MKKYSIFNFLDNMLKIYLFFKKRVDYISEIIYNLNAVKKHGIILKFWW